MAAPETLLIKLSAQQHSDFTTCAKMCGLDLVAWIVQCADVQAAAAIDALQASQRVQRPDRKKHRPRGRRENPGTAKPAPAEVVDRDTVTKGPGKDPTTRKNSGRSSVAPGKNTPGKSATLEAALAFNARFRHSPDASRDKEA